jgi:predicted metal-dependent HD superfamily phosphohydrolase
VEHWGRGGALDRGTARGPVGPLVGDAPQASHGRSQARDARCDRTAGRVRHRLRPGGRDDNEDRSAELARELLASSPIRDEVVRLVLVTKTHKVDDDVNGAVLCDADLSVLGSDAQRYRTYAAAVREEYADVPDDAFRPARAQVLASLLDGPLFHTAAGRVRWEQVARHNLAGEIRALNG